MEGHIHHQHHHQLQHQQQYQHQYGVVQQQQQQSMGGMVGVDAGDRFPQWSVHETKEFLDIRAELDQAFMETKRNKLLWEVISSKMREKGFFRSSDQCKCKWKNLVTRYKGCETIEDETVRQQFPFYNEMQAIFTSRMQRMLWAEAEAAETSRKTKQPPASSGEEEEEEDQEEGEDDQQNSENMMKRINKNKKKTSKRAKVMVGSGGGGERRIIMGVKEMVEEIMKQQMEMEEKWREAYEAREEERRRVEREWRERMEALENERVEIERRWREREEERRLREEARAQHRDALITALLNKLSSSQPPPNL